MSKRTREQEKPCSDSCNSVFVCDKCGACCSHLRAFGAIYSFLDNGEGVCRYFDAETHLCSVYPVRPLLCRIREGYLAFFASSLSWEDYLAGVREGCQMLKRL